MTEREAVDLHKLFDLGNIPSRVVFSFSSDGGRTWSYPVDDHEGFRLLNGGPFVVQTPAQTKQER